MFKLDTPIFKNPDIQWKLIEGRAVLLDFDEAILLQLDDVATRIWLMLDGKVSAQNIIDNFTANFEVEKKQAQKDVCKFLKRLLKDRAIEFYKRGE
jgi:hypothetical protein